MAVQKSKVTRARRGKRRSHQSLTTATTTLDTTSGEIRLRHNISADGFYRGRKVVQQKAKNQAPAAE